MGRETGIKWCRCTFNPIWGCQEVSPGCDGCYARTWAKRTGWDVWGRDAPRRTFGEEHWGDPLKWDAEAAAAGELWTVFCGSMCDVMEDHPVWATERPKLFDLWRSTPHLIWLALTKRPGNFRRFLPPDWGRGYPNVWLGTTVEDRKRKTRISELAAVPARRRFLSMEPLIERVDLTPEDLASLDWVIVGGESGRKREDLRLFDLTWARVLRDQVKAAGKSFFLKQAGDLAALPYYELEEWRDETHNGDDAELLVDGGSWDAERDGQPPRRTLAVLPLRAKKGGDLQELPEDLRLQEVPPLEAA